MATIILWKRYSDGEVRSLEINDNPEAVHQLLKVGFWLSKQEAEEGKIKPKPKPRAKRVTKKSNDK